MKSEELLKSVNSFKRNNHMYHLAYFQFSMQYKKKKKK